MKDICKDCYYCSILRTDGNIVGTSCEFPISVFLEQREAGLYNKDTEDSCYDFKEKKKE